MQLMPSVLFPDIIATGIIPNYASGHSLHGRKVICDRRITIRPIIFKQYAGGTPNTLVVMSLTFVKRIAIACHQSSEALASFWMYLIAIRL